MTTKQFFSVFSAVLLSLLAVSSCGKKDDAAPEYPVLQITSPVANQMILNNGEVHITGKATASGEDASRLLHSISIQVLTLPDSAEVFTMALHIHGYSEYDIDTTFTPSVTQNQDMLLVAKLENHIPRTTVQYVPFMVHP